MRGVGQAVEGGLAGKRHVEQVARASDDVGFGERGAGALKRQRQSGFGIGFGELFLLLRRRGVEAQRRVGSAGDKCGFRSPPARRWGGFKLRYIVVDRAHQPRFFHARVSRQNRPVDIGCENGADRRHQSIVERRGGVEGHWVGRGKRHHEEIRITAGYTRQTRIGGGEQAGDQKGSHAQGQQGETVDPAQQEELAEDRGDVARQTPMAKAMLATAGLGSSASKLQITATANGICAPSLQPVA